MAENKADLKENGNKKVLVIEDDILLCDIVSEALIVEGFKVVTVNDGSVAFDTAKKEMPNLILLDLILPGVDGFEVLKLLKADEETQDIPVAIISNLGNVADVKSVSALGATEYFIKANTDLDKIVKYVKKGSSKGDGTG